MWLVLIAQPSNGQPAVPAAPVSSATATTTLPPDETGLNAAEVAGLTPGTYDARYEAAIESAARVMRL